MNTELKADIQRIAGEPDTLGIADTLTLSSAETEELQNAAVQRRVCFEKVYVSCSSLKQHPVEAHLEVARAHATSTLLIIRLCQLGGSLISGTTTLEVILVNEFLKPYTMAPD